MTTLKNIKIIEEIKMNYVSNKEQVLIYLGKFKRNFLNANGWYAFVTTIIIALIACIVSGQKEGFDSRIVKTSFIIVCACIWIGIFNSITLICRERDIIKHEYRGGMNLSSYMFAHMLFQGIISLIQAAIFSSVLFLFYGSKIAEFPTTFDSSILRFVSYFFTLFLTIYSSAALGLFVSSLVKNVEQAMTVMPFVILLQFLFSGNITLGGFLKFLSFLTVSRYGYDGILNLSDAKVTSITIEVANASEEQIRINLILCWIILIAFSILFAYLASKFLKSVENDTRS